MRRQTFATSPARGHLATPARASSRQLHRARALPIGHVASRRASIFVAACLGSVAFLWIYAALHVAHVEGVDVSPVSAIAPIPLFSGFLASLALATVSSIPAALVFRLARLRPTSLSSVLTWSIVTFGAVVILFP